MVFFRYLLWVVLWSSLAVAQETSFILPQPLIVPEGEKLFFPEAYEALPGLGLERLRNQGVIQSFASAESVEDGASLMVYQHDAGGALFSDTTSFQSLEDDGSFTNYTGLSFWVKGSGSEAYGVIAFSSMDPRKGPSAHLFSLSNTNWHKVFVPWTAFYPRLKFVKKPSAFIFSFGAEGVGVRWYLIDRLHLYKDEEVEEIAPTPRTETVHDLEVAGWIRKADSFDEAYHKLENREQFSLVFLVDEGAIGKALLANVVKDSLLEDENFSGRLGHRIRKRFLYHEGHTFLEKYVTSIGRWVPITDSPLRQARFETGTLVFSGVQTEFILQHFQKVKSYDPDLIVVQHGLYDILYGSIDRYRAALRKVAQGIKDAGAVGVICSPFPVPDFRGREHLNGRSPWEMGAAFAAVCDEVAMEYDLSYVDCYGAFNARGPQALGEVFFHRHDLKFKGHQMAADLLYGLIDQRRVKLWREAPSL